MRNFCVLLSVLISCNEVNTTFPDPYEFPVKNKNFLGNVQIQKLKSTHGFKVLLKNSANETIDQTIFKYTPYQLDTADVNRDGTTEILIGLIKVTKFDSTEKKRLFILRIDDGHLRPLWLGSKVCQELVNFKSKDNGVIQTIERSASGSYSIGDYYWESFGLTLRHYTHTEISLNDALQIFNYEN